MENCLRNYYGDVLSMEEHYRQNQVYQLSKRSYTEEGRVQMVSTGNVSCGEKNVAEMEMQPVSAVQVNKFMLERTEEYLLCALVLLELRMGTAVKMMKNSEHISKIQKDVSNTSSQL